MSKEAKRWWEANGQAYQDECQIPIDVHYGTGSPNENDLGLIGSVTEKRVLELGCGGAQCSIAFAKHGAIVTAIDIAASELEFARNLAEKNDVSITFHQLNAEDLSPISDESQDIVFSACAFPYVDNLLSCFREVHRVLVGGGLFVFSQGHPVFGLVNPETLKLEKSYFEIGKIVLGEEKDIPFATNYRTVSDLFNLLVESGFVVESLIEPDSRVKYPYDAWYGKWNHTPELMQKLPATIIFKSRKGRI
jgi:SAM-dependent methyltransferase